MLLSGGVPGCPGFLEGALPAFCDGYRHLLPRPAFMGAGDPNLGAHACRVSSFPTWPLPSPGRHFKHLPLFLLPLFSSTSHIFFTKLQTSTLAPIPWQEPSRQALGSMKLRTQAVLASMVGLEQCAGPSIQVSMAGQVPVEKNFCLPTVSSKPSLSRHTYPSAAWLGETTGCGPRVTRGLPDHTPHQLTA